MATRPKRPRDPSQLAKLIVDLSTGEAQEQNPNEGKNPKAILRGQLGGLKGGNARARALSSSKRQEIAKKAAAARWSKSSSK